MHKRQTSGIYNIVFMYAKVFENGGNDMDFKKFWYANLDRIVNDKLEADKKSYIKSDTEESLYATIEKASNLIGKQNLIRSLEYCGGCCIDPDLIKNARQQLEKLNDMDKVLEELNKEGIGGGKMYREGENIYATYENCYCPLVEMEKEVPAVYCNCSRGWFKAFFGGLLKKDVEVELLSSIVRGGTSCEFIIHI